MPDTGRDLKEVVVEHRRELVDHDRQINTNTQDIKTLREVVDLKITGLADDVKEIKNILKWAGGLIVSLIISFMAWALLQQYNANEQSKKDLQHQIEMLQEQKTARTERHNTQTQLDAVDTSRTESATAAPAGR